MYHNDLIDQRFAELRRTDGEILHRSDKKTNEVPSEIVKIFLLKTFETKSNP